MYYIVLVHLCTFLTTCTASSFKNLEDVAQDLSTHPMAILPLEVIDSIFEKVDRCDLVNFLRSSEAALEARPTDNFMDSLLTKSLPDSFILKTDGDGRDDTERLLEEL